MASREEEKRRRREEREAAMRAEQAKAAKGKRLQIVLAAVLVLAIVAGGAVALLSSGGDDPKADAGPANTVSIPQGVAGDLEQAAKDAGCEVKTHESEGRGHVEGEVSYKTNPPTSGSHHPQAAQDGLYDPGNEPAKENLVHSLEHGRILFQYKKGSPRDVIDKIETLASEPLNGANGYHTIAFQNNTDMPYAVAVTAWTRSLTCRSMSDGFFAVARKFRQDYTDKAPEFIP